MLACIAFAPSVCKAAIAVALWSVLRERLLAAERAAQVAAAGALVPVKVLRLIH